MKLHHKKKCLYTNFYGNTKYLREFVHGALKSIISTFIHIVLQELMANIYYSTLIIHSMLLFIT